MQICTIEFIGVRYLKVSTWSHIAESSDSETESSDSETESSDSETESSDSESSTDN